VGWEEEEYGQKRRGGTGELAAGDVQMDWLRDGCHGDHGQLPLLHTACFQVSS